MSKTAPHLGASPNGHTLTEEAFAAICRVEGLELTKSSRDRLESLLVNPTLSPVQRRAAILEFYKGFFNKKKSKASR